MFEPPRASCIAAAEVLCVQHKNHSRESYSNRKIFIREYSIDNRSGRRRAGKRMGGAEWTAVIVCIVHLSLDPS